MSKEAAFSVFCLENYDVLHTTGYQYINHDIDIYLKSRNAVITA